MTNILLELERLEKESGIREEASSIRHYRIDSFPASPWDSEAKDEYELDMIRGEAWVRKELRRLYFSVDDASLRRSLMKAEVAWNRDCREDNGKFVKELGQKLKSEKILRTLLSPLTQVSAGFGVLALIALSRINIEPEPYALIAIAIGAGALTSALIWFFWRMISNGIIYAESEYEQNLRMHRLRDVVIPETFEAREIESGAPLQNPTPI